MAVPMAGLIGSFSLFPSFVTWKESPEIGGEKEKVHRSLIVGLGLRISSHCHVMSRSPKEILSYTLVDSWQLAEDMTDHSRPFCFPSPAFAFDLAYECRNRHPFLAPRSIPTLGLLPNALKPPLALSSSELHTLRASSTFRITFDLLQRAYILAGLVTLESLSRRKHFHSAAAPVSEDNRPHPDVEVQQTLPRDAAAVRHRLLPRVQAGRSPDAGARGDPRAGHGRPRARECDCGPSAVEGEGSGGGFGRAAAEGLFSWGGWAKGGFFGWEAGDVGVLFEGGRGRGIGFGCGEMLVLSLLGIGQIMQRNKVAERWITLNETDKTSADAS
nr:hypothetical protein CFP56_11864 [Quercus suber]